MSPLNRVTSVLKSLTNVSARRWHHHTSLTRGLHISGNGVASTHLDISEYNLSALEEGIYPTQLLPKCYGLWLPPAPADLINNMDKKATWDRFYTENSRKGHFKNFEWFFGFHAVKDHILPLLQSMSDTPAPLHVLDIGCGTSALGPGIYTHSQCAVKVTCADISPVAVQLMQEHVESTPVQPCNPASTLVFREIDCTVLEGHFEPRSLALIVDKGTTDALVRSKEGRAKAGQIVCQCLTVLRRSGSLLQFSDEDPDARLLWLENASKGSEVAADVSVHEVGKLRGVTYFCYQMTPYTAQH